MGRERKRRKKASPREKILRQAEKTSLSPEKKNGSKRRKGKDKINRKKRILGLKFPPGKKRGKKQRNTSAEQKKKKK